MTHKVYFKINNGEPLFQQEIEHGVKYMSFVFDTVLFPSKEDLANGGKVQYIIISRQHGKQI